MIDLQVKLGQLLREFAVLPLQGFLSNRGSGRQPALPRLVPPALVHATRDLVLTAGSADR